MDINHGLFWGKYACAPSVYPVKYIFMEISLKTTFTIVLWAVASVLAGTITVGRPDSIAILLWVSVPLYCLVVTFLVLDQRDRPPKNNRETDQG
jgi:hypothetical protein